MTKTLTILFALISSIIYSQDKIDWDGKYQLELTDFKSPSTQIGNTNLYSLNTPSGIEFSFSMSNMEFLFTKNFNSKVSNSFKPNASSLVAPDEKTANDLKNFAKYQFDLSELYARKLRKRLYEEKGAFTNADFFKPIYDEIQNEFTQRMTTAGKETDMGRNPEKLKVLHQQILIEIQELSNFCKACKTPSKKK